MNCKVGNIPLRHMNSSVVGIMFRGDDQTLREIFQTIVDQSSDNLQGCKSLPFATGEN